MRTIIGVGGLKVSDNPDELIITYALGSCLGIAAYDTKIRVGGLLHVMLPLSKTDPEKAKLRPTIYVDTGVNLMLRKMYKMRSKRRNLKIVVAGGAHVNQNKSEDHFKIGRGNITAFRKLMWKKGLKIINQDVGGTKSRSMTLKIANGEVTINRKLIRTT